MVFKFRIQGGKLGEYYGIKSTMSDAKGLVIDINAFRKAGRQINYRDKILVTTLAPCWYCSGLIRQFNIGTVIIGEAVNFEGHKDWLIEAGVKIVDLSDTLCIALMRSFIEQSPHIWFEDIGESHRA